MKVALLALALLAQPGPLTPTTIGSDVAVDAVVKTERVADLVKLLEHDEFAVRQAAEKKLYTLGPSALSALDDWADHKDPDVRIRIDQIRVAIRNDVQQVKKEVFYRTFTDFPHIDAWRYQTHKTGYAPLRMGGDLYGSLSYIETCYFRSPANQGNALDPRSYANYREATRLLFEDLYFNHDAPIELLQLLALEMFRRDKVFLDGAFNRERDGLSTGTSSTYDLHWRHPDWMPKCLLFKNYDLQGLFHFVTNLK